MQWEEIDISRLSFSRTTPAVTEVRAAMRANTIAKGLATTPSEDITTALRELAFDGVVVHDYGSQGRDTFAAAAKEWTKAGARAVLPRALERLQEQEQGPGGDKAKTKAKADELLADYARDIDGGVIPTIPLIMVVGQKV